MKQQKTSNVVILVAYRQLLSVNVLNKKFLFNKGSMMKNTVQNSSDSAIPVLYRIEVLGFASYLKFDRAPVTATFWTFDEIYYSLLSGKRV